MKICLVHEEYPEETNFGGIATYQKRLAEEYVKQGHSVYVIARGLKTNQHYVENGVDITRIFVEQTPDQVHNYIEYRKRVADELIRLQDNNLIDIVEVPDWGAESVLFEDYRKIPLVVRLHTPLKVWLKFNKNNFGLVTDLMLEWEDKMLKSADLVTCCSKILKKMIVKDFKMPARLIKVTPNPADLKYFYKDENIAKENRILYVGSLEERKGVCVLARALNIFFKRYPDVQIDLIGKDTIRNNKNISTIEYVKQIVKPEYHKNINFLGQKKNFELNEYYNRSRVAIFPSLFDNFPYVTLEAMATGVQVVGSRNSGMVEMLADRCVYETPDHKSLAKLIKMKYKESFEKPYNEANIKRVNSLFNSTTVCNNMVKYYQSVLKDFKNYYVSKEELEKTLEKVGVTGKIINYNRILSGVANAVYKVQTEANIYIVKKYNYNIDFELASELYPKYDQIGVCSVVPINNSPIVIQDKLFNVYEYVDGEQIKENLVEKLKGFVLCDRKTNKANRVVDKCEFYYNGLIDLRDCKIKKDVEFVVEEYKKLRNNSILKETFINHGDISKSNLLVKDGVLYVIDFDETTIAPMLYDFAVVSVKFFLNKGKFDYNLYNQFVKEIVEKTNYSASDCGIVLKFYLCKILLEKFYLHVVNKIDVFSKEQKRDDYKVYLNLLKEV